MTSVVRFKWINGNSELSERKKIYFHKLQSNFMYHTAHTMHYNNRSIDFIKLALL